MKRLVVKMCIVLFYIMNVIPCFSDSGLSVKSIIFLPGEYFVGDTVEARIMVQPDGGGVFAPPSRLQEYEWLAYHEVTVKKEKNGTLVIISFTPYAPGTRTLPPIKLGSAILDSVKIHTTSILARDGASFKGIKKPLFLPGTRLLLGIVIAVLFIGPVFILWFTGSIKPKLNLARALRQGKKSQKQLYKVLKDLDEEKERMSSRQFYFELSDAYRKYLWKRTGVDFMTITSTDFGLNLEKILGPGRIVQSASAMVKFSDSIKFGGVTVNAGRKIHDLSIVRESVHLLEKSFESRKRSISLK